eukprot:jgi/Picsp_1/3435/NSC_06273-R1_wd40 repeat domain-containing protein
MEGICRSLGSDGSVTALAMVTDIRKLRSNGHGLHGIQNKIDVIENDRECKNNDGGPDGRMGGDSFALVGLCSRLLVIDVFSGKVVASAVALPFGLRIHGIQWIPWSFFEEEENSDSMPSVQSVLLVVHGRNCLNYWELKVGGSNGVAKLCKLFESKGIEKWIYSVSLKVLFPGDSKNRSVLATVGCIDNSVMLFHVNVWEKTVKLLGHAYGESRCLLYSMDLFDNLYQLIDYKKELRSSPGERDEMGYTCKVAGGTILWDIAVWKLRADILAEKDGAIGIRNISTETLFRLKGHRGSIHCVRWGSSGQILASGSDDRLVKIWRLNEMSDNHDGSNNNKNTIDVSSELFGHKNRIWEIRFSSDDSLLFSGAEDGCLITWDLATSTRISEIKAHRFRGIWHILQHNNLLYTGGADGAVKVWNLWDWVPRRCIEPLLCHLDRYKDARSLCKGWQMSICSSESFCSSNIDWSIQQHLNFLISYGKCGALAKFPLEDQIPMEILETKSREPPRDSKSEWIRCMEFAKHGQYLIIGTNRGRLLIVEMNLDLGVEQSKPLFLISEPKNSDVSPCISLNVLDGPSFIIVGSTSFRGDVNVFRVDIPFSKFEVTQIQLDTSLLASKPMDIHFIRIHDKPYMLTGSLKGECSLFSIDSTSSEALAAGSFQCPNQVRITSCGQCNLGKDQTVLALGSGMGGLSIWKLSPQGYKVAIHNLGSHKNCHDKTPVQWISLSLSTTRRMYLQSAACNACIQHYSLELFDDTNAAKFYKLNEQRCDPIGVVGEKLTVGNQPKDVICGVYTTNFAVWDESLDAEACSIYCAGWRRPFSYYVDTESGLVVFCMDRGLGKVCLYTHRLPSIIPEAEKPVQPPDALIRPGHGQEINRILAFGNMGFLTASEDATIRVGRWTSIAGNCPGLSGGSIFRVQSRCLSTQPGGTAIRTMDKIRLFEESRKCWLVVTGGAKEVLTAWISNGMDEEDLHFHNISTHADISVRKNYRNQEKNGLGDIRIIALSLISSPFHDSLSLLVIGKSNGNVELRSVPTNAPESLRYHTWPLLAQLNNPHEMECPVLSLSHAALEKKTIIFGGTTNGDIIVWEISDIIHDREELDVRSLDPIAWHKGVHQSGVNGMSVTTHTENHNISIIVSGGDDQSLNVMMVGSDGALLQNVTLPNAHTSAIRDVWADKDTVFSIGLDQQIRIWRISAKYGSHNLAGQLDSNGMRVLKLTEMVCRYLQVLEPASLDVCTEQENKGKSYIIQVAGRGMEIIYYE